MDPYIGCLSGNFVLPPRPPSLLFPPMHLLALSAPNKSSLISLVLAPCREGLPNAGLANITGTCISLLGLQPPAIYEEALI